jgi:hypothetical protein
VQQALASAQQLSPFLQQSALAAPWQQGKFAWQQARFNAQQSADFCLAGLGASMRPNPRIDPAINFINMDFSPRNVVWKIRDHCA